MDIIDTLLLKVNHKEVSPQTSPTAYSQDWKATFSTYYSQEYFTTATNHPPEDIGTWVAIARASTSASNAEIFRASQHMLFSWEHSSHA